MIFIDSSYIISLIFENDINHLKAMQIRDRIKCESKITNNTVITEVLNSLKPHNCRLEANYIFNQLLTIHKIDYLNSDDYIKSMKIFNYYNKSINFADCTMLKTMFEYNIGMVISFDDDFDKINGIINVKL